MRGERRGESDVIGAVGVKVGERAERAESPHHGGGKGIEDRGGKTVCERHGKKRTVHHVARGQTEGDVGNAERRMTAEIAADRGERAERGKRG